MKSVTEDYNKIYLENKEVTLESLYLGSELVSVLHKPLKLPFRELGSYEVGDVVLWDSTKKYFRVISPENISMITDKNRYIPIGVVAIPSSHDVYGTGECGVMALLSASLTTPDTGQISNANIYWGAYGTDYPELNNYDQLVYSKINKNDTGVVQGIRNIIYLPSDAFSAAQCSTDPLAFYNWDDKDPYAPSPYLEDGSRNPAYYQTESPSSTANALSDFAGKSNTEFLCSKAIAQPDWKTAVITNNSNAGYHPAACVCWRYHTTGTSQGDWYLPACGELGYACVRRKKINETITALRSHFGITLLQLDTKAYWSSSEYDSNNVRGVNFSSGYVNSFYRNGSSFVRPFTRIK